MYRLNQAPLASPIVSAQGKHAHPCEKCPLQDVCVGGCCESHSICIQKVCHQECDDCGGGPPLRFTGANVPAICSKAPLRDVQLLEYRKDRYEFRRHKIIKPKSRSFIINQGSPGRIEGCPYPKGCEMVAVNLRHVWSSRGWFSRDVRDYLAVDKGTKILLLTSTHDDVLDRAWEQGVQYSDFAELGFDYWQAIEFSGYGPMSRCYNLWTSYRCLAAQEASGSQFFPSPELEALATSRPGVLDPWIFASRAAPQLLQNWQFTSSKDPTGFRWMIANLKRMLCLLPALKAVWFVGVVSGSEAYNITLNFPEHECYFLAVNPWLAAFKGDEFSKVGKLTKSRLPRKELVIQNQVNYHNLIQRAYTDARKHMKEGSHG